MWSPLLLAAAVVYCIPVAKAITLADCPDNLPRNSRYLKTYGDKCYYFYLNERLDFEDAKKTCYKGVGRLVLVKTRETNKFLHSELAYTFWNDTSDAHKNVWIGLSDQEQEGNFQWVDGTPLEYDNFANFQGTSGLLVRGINDDCVAMNPKTGQWYDYRCGSSLVIFDEHRPFVCEYEPKQSGIASSSSPSTTMPPDDNKQT